MSFGRHHNFADYQQMSALRASADQANRQLRDLERLICIVATTSLLMAIVAILGGLVAGPASPAGGFTPRELLGPGAHCAQRSVVSTIPTESQSQANRAIGAFSVPNPIEVAACIGSSLP